MQLGVCINCGGLAKGIFRDKQEAARYDWTRKDRKQVPDEVVRSVGWDAVVRDLRAGEDERRVVSIAVEGD